MKSVLCVLVAVLVLILASPVHAQGCPSCNLPVLLQPPAAPKPTVKPDQPKEQPKEQPKKKGLLSRIFKKKSK